MTIDQIRSRIDAFVGLNSELVPDGTDFTLRYCSPTGVELLTVEVYSRDDGTLTVGGVGSPVLFDAVRKAAKAREEKSWTQD